MKIRNISLRSRSFNIRKAIEFIKAYSTFILLFSLFTSGLIIGTLTVKNSGYCRYILSVFTIDGAQLHFQLINRIFPVIITLTINFIMGLCLVGTPFIYSVSVAEGIYFSMLYAYRLYAYGYGNIAEFILSDVIFFILLSVITALSQYTAIIMSEALKNYFCYHKGAISIRSYLLKSALFLTFSIGIVLVQSFIKILI